MVVYSLPVRQSLGQLPALRRTVVSHYAVPHVRVARIQAGAPGMQTSGCVRRSAGGESNARSNNLSGYVPMLNVQGFCESAWRRAGQVRECPHKKMRKAVSNLNTADKK